MNPMRRTAAVAFLVLASILGACSSHGEARTHGHLTKIDVMLDWTPNTNHAGMYLAEAKGWYRDVGLDVRFLQPGGGGDVAQAVASGSVDFGVSSAEQVVPARAQGLPVVSVAAIIQHNTSSLVSLAGSGITRPRDIQGHTYGGFGGGFEKALVETLVRCDGGDPSKVRFATVGDVDYRQGMERGQYDVVWVFDGWDVIKIDQLDGVALDRIPFAEHTDCIPDWYTPVLITSEREISGQPKAVRRFLEATRKGYQAAMADPDGAADALLAAVPELDGALVRASARFLSTRYAPDPAQWGRQDDETWATFVAFLVEHDLVSADYDVDATFDASFLAS